MTGARDRELEKSAQVEVAPENSDHAFGEVILISLEKSAN